LGWSGARPILAVVKSVNFIPSSFSFPPFLSSSTSVFLLQFVPLLVSPVKRKNRGQGWR
jgi:hypothetical protein